MPYPTRFFPVTLTTVALAALLGLSISRAAEISGGEGKTGSLKPPERVPEPKLAKASDEPEKAMKKFRLPAGFTSDVWAAEPLLGNPVAFCLDEKGRVFVAETHRYRSSALDIRHYMFMLEDDLASRTAEDRIKFTKESFPKDWQKLEIETEVVRLVEDRDGDGKADFSAPYAAGMNTILDGINSGVLAHDDKVWCTNMPNLWLFSGTTKDGKAEKRESLSFGYGVRFSFTGHDMHGLALGPDGRVYFSFGDRGAHVKTKEGKTLDFSDEGAVFRCEPDGTHMEVVARGLRNPQELAFDNHGNLFTGDNDSDQGDRERWVYVVEGGDSGWRVGWQHNPLGKERNPWMADDMWEPRKEGTPFYILSPIVNIPDGPSGIAHNPGTGLPAEYDEHFFVCGFKGSSARSAIATLKVKEVGAGFAVDRPPTTFIGEVQATDVDFGPDSKLYLSEWGEGWEGTGRGRIFRAWHPEAQKAQAEQIADVKKLLNEGFKQRSVAELSRLLAHKDQRIRLQAQWALAEKPNASKTFLEVATKGTTPLARLHGIWGLGHVARLTGYKSPKEEAKTLAYLIPLLSDKDAEVRAQTAKVLGDGKVAQAAAQLMTALDDENLRVRFFAAQSLGKLGSADVVEPVLAMIKENADKDQYLRHAGVMALVGSKNTKAIEAAAKDGTPSIRLAALLAMRRLQSPSIAQFFNDKDPLLVREAARAINDVPISGAFGELAKFIEHPINDEQLMLRVINANFRRGTPESAQAIANYAASDATSEPLRAEALNALATWPKPAARDRVVGTFRPIGDREEKPAALALSAALPKLLALKSPGSVIAAIEAARALGVKDGAPLLSKLLSDEKADAKARGEALKTLAAFDDPKLGDAIKLAMADKNAGLRIEAVALLAKLNPDEAAKQLTAAFADSSVEGKKTILTALGDIKSTAADQTLASMLDDLSAGKMPPEAQLELLEAAAKRKAPAVKQKLESYQANIPKGDVMAAFAPTLAGGDKAAGQRLFNEHSIAACLRCHKVNGTGGEAGPDLTGIAQKKDRKYLLEAIILPNAQIADGFQSVMVTMKSGELQAGVIKSETDTELTLQMPVPGAPAIKVAKADIKARENAPSGMPPGLGDLLTKRELRDIVEYVASLK